MIAMNTDVSSYLHRSLEKCLVVPENDKKNNYLEECLQLQWNIYLFVLFVEIILGMEADTKLKRIVSCLVSTWQHP